MSNLHDLAEERALRQSAAPLRKGDGDDTSGGMSGHVTNLESRLTRLESAAVGAFVFLIVAFGSGYVLLSNQISAGFDRMSDKVEAVSTQVAGVGERVARLEGAADKAP